VKPMTWQNRAHFFGIAARIMRLVVVDHGRRYSCMDAAAERARTRKISRGPAPGSGEQ
jgi:hypothetical protein